MESNVHKIFNKGSRTFSSSSIFFPKSIRDDVAVFYSFVRRADDYLDQEPQDKKNYFKFKDDYIKGLSGENISDQIVQLYIQLTKSKKIDEKWTEKFFESMEMDIIKKDYQCIDELIKYIHGSAEVIGLIMAKLLNLNEESYPYAQMLGRSFQYINFIRDINKDLHLGRTYMPQDELAKFNLKNLNLDTINSNKENFYKFINFQIERYLEWQKFAEKGYKFIPKKYLIPIKTSADMFIWTARQIQKEPMIIYKKKVKPSKLRIILTGIINILTV